MRRWSRFTALFAVTRLLLVLPENGKANISQDVRHILTMGPAVPIPLQILGYNPSVKGSSASYSRLAGFNCGYHRRLRRWESSWIGFRLDGASIQLQGDTIQMIGRIIRMGPEFLFLLVRGVQAQWQVALGAGPVFSLTHFEVDSDIQGNLPSFGFQTHIWCGRQIYRRLYGILDAGMAHSFRPFTSPTFFNHVLGPSTWLSFSVGILIQL